MVRFFVLLGQDEKRETSMEARQTFLTVRVTEERYAAYSRAARLDNPRASLSDYVRDVLDRSTAQRLAKAEAARPAGSAP